MRKISAKAKRIHKDAILIDGHNDHLILKVEENKPLDFMTVNRRYHSDGTRLLAGGVTASMFMVDGHFLDRSVSLIEKTHREIEAHSDKLMLVTKTSHILKAKRTGRLGIIMSWESGRAARHDLDLLRAAYRLGLRCSTITHNEGGTTEYLSFGLQGTPSPCRYCELSDRDTFRRMSLGLTDFGKAAVKEMNALGILVDIAHANDAAIDDIFKLTTKPVISSHGGAFALCPHSRCSTDEQIEAIAASGGLLSVILFGKFIAKPPKRGSVKVVVDHIEYVAELVGIQHVGIGTDFDGLMPGQWPVIRSADELPRITDEMVRRGFSEADIRKVWGENYLRVFKATIG